MEIFFFRCMCAGCGCFLLNCPQIISQQTYQGSESRMENLQGCRITRQRKHWGPSDKNDRKTVEKEVARGGVKKIKHHAEQTKTKNSWSAYSCRKNLLKEIKRTGRQTCA